MGSNLKVLIVEDSPAQAAVIVEIVRQLGFSPAVYNELPRGITQVLALEQPALVLLDLRLLDFNGRPIADGFQICREIKRSPYNTPVVVISAEGEEDACEWALLQGADAYLQKPFAAGDLTQVIGELLESEKST